MLLKQVDITYTESILCSYVDEMIFNTFIIQCILQTMISNLTDTFVSLVKYRNTNICIDLPEVYYCCQRYPNV